MDGCSVVRRFASKNTGWDNGYLYAIQFKSDRDIRILGFGVYVGEGKSIATTRLLKIDGNNEDSAVEIATNEVIVDCPSKTINRISFTSPVVIRANEWHVISIWIRGEFSDYGKGGQARVEADGVVFDFRYSKLSENKYAVEIGQIPEIYFEKVDPDQKVDGKSEEQKVEIQNLQVENEKLQIELGDMKLKYQQQQTEVEELKEKLIQSKLEALQSVRKTLKFAEHEKLDKLFVTIQLENGNIIYYDNVKPFELFTIIDGKREIADLKQLEGEYDCSFKGAIENYAYFSSSRGKIVKFFKVSIVDSKMQLEQINELKTTDLIPFENQPLYFIEESREWIVYQYHENYTEMDGEKFDISGLRSIRKFDCHYHRGILYFFRENTTAKLEKLNEKVVVVEAPVLDGKLSYYIPPHSDYIYVANTDKNILITLNTTNLHVSQHSYEPPIGSTYHSIVGVHDGILTMVFEGTGVGRRLMTTKLP